MQSMSGWKVHFWEGCQKSVLRRKHRIFWWRMVSILYITLSNAHNRTLVSVIVEVEQLDRRASNGCLPNNA